MKRYRNSEKGVALLIALFALLLLSAVGLSMMFSADAETSINANYREKQQVNYASLSGALEAKDRLQPANTSSPNYIAMPSDAPKTSAANVFYIVNPASGETVEPWNPSNPFADTELCHENVLGLSGTAGVPCEGSASLPTGSTWRAVYDNSAVTFAGSYKLSNPLQYKWTRIQLKTDNSGPVPVGPSPSGKIVCWDGINQIPLPLGYKNDCSPMTGTVSFIKVNSGGNYNATPNVSISAPTSGGTTAQATAHMKSTPTGQISGITVTTPGSGYTSQPTVDIIGDGFGATAVANVIGSSVTSVSLTSSGNQCYLAPPPVSFTGGGGGTGAAATAVLGGNTCIYSISGGSCSANGWKGQTLSVGASGGSNDFSAQITFKNGTGIIQGVSITNPGTNYTTPPTVLTSSAGSCTPGSTIQLGKNVVGITLTSGGTGYTSNPTVTIAPGVGSGAQPTATATVSGGGANAGEIASITVTNGGSGYTLPPIVTITGGGGTGATATASLATVNAVDYIEITNPGSGYLTPPTVSFSGGGGSGALAQAFLSNGVYYGRVLTLTSMAITKNNTRAMSQMEVATPVRQLSVTGALTLAGPSPTFSAPNSNPFTIDGNDLNSCGPQTGEDPQPPHPAVGVFDDPNSPTDPTAEESVIAALPRPQNYIGAKPAPDIENVYGALGDSMTSPAGLDALAVAVTSVATNIYGSNPGGINMGSASSPTITVVNGDLTLSGNPHGYGILLVTGNLNMSGNFSWNGVVLVIGKGVVNNSGGGNGQIIGTMIVAKTRDAAGNLLTTGLGSPNVNWNGGGGNGIRYDHCWADKMLANVPYVPPPSTRPLKILSTRTVSY